MWGDVEQIKRAGERAAALTGQLLAHSRQQVLEPTVVDLNAVVTDVESFLRHTLGEPVELVLDLAPELDLIRVDRTQMEQVLLNLAINS